jgi:hypothetical protein
MTTRNAGTLARFATESGRLTDSVVKPKLFEPNRALELSVFRVHGLEFVQICGIGVSVVKEHPNARRLHGWGEIGESEVQGVNLRVVYDDVPPRHANIVGWPTEASQRKSIQQVGFESSSN